MTQQHIDGWGNVIPGSSVASAKHPVRRRHPRNTADGNGGGQEGYSITVTNIVGSYAGMTVNNSETVDVGNTLYSPTMRPGDPSCIEATNIIDSTSGGVAFYAFCGSAHLDNDGNDGYYGELDYSDPNFADYTTTFNSHKIVTIQVMQVSNGTWHGMIFNYNKAQYELRLYTNGSCVPPPHFARLDAPGGCNLSGGTPNGGWIIHETHYTSGVTCSPVSQKQAQSLQTTTNGSTWVQPTTDPSSFAFHNYTDGAYGGGFYSYRACSQYGTQGTTTPPWYVFTPSTNPGSGYLWQVNSHT